MWKAILGVTLAGSVAAAIGNSQWRQLIISKAHAEGGFFSSAGSGNRFVDEGVREKHREADQMGKDFQAWDGRRICWQDRSRARQFERDTGYSMSEGGSCEPMQRADVQRKPMLPPAPVAPQGYDDEGLGCECRVPEPPTVKRSHFEQQEEYGSDYHSSYTQYYQ